MMAEPLTVTPGRVGERVLRKAQGALLALAAGDALGWPQETRGRAQGSKAQVPSESFREWRRRAGGRFHPYEERIRAGEYSDDTQLTLAVARARLTGGRDWWTALTRSEIPLWKLYERGGGGGVKRAAESWLRGRPPWKEAKEEAVAQYFRAGGNGVAMRVLPHAIFYSGTDSFEPVLHDVILDGVATHGHPRALVGAAVFAYGSWRLLRLEETLSFGELIRTVLTEAREWRRFPRERETRNGWMQAADRAFTHGFLSAWEEGVEEMLGLLEQVSAELQHGALADDDDLLRRLGCFDPRVNGAGTVSAAAALYLCSRYAAQPVQGVLKAAFASEADTDTLAAMTGALSGCLAGSDWVPYQWNEVQDADYLRSLVSELAVGPSRTSVRPLPRSVRETDLKRILAALEKRTEVPIDLNGVDSARVVGTDEHLPLSVTTRVHGLKLRFSSGQTAYVTLVRKVPRSGAPRLRQPGVAGRATGGQQPLRHAVAVHLTVNRLGRMADFYRRFGLDPVSEKAGSVDFGYFLLVQSLPPEKTQENLPFSEGPGKFQLVISVPDWLTVREKASSEGIMLIELEPLPPGHRRFVCRDPEGNTVEVREAPQHLLPPRPRALQRS